jgi:Tfp pilus assembly protein PilF
VGRKRMWPMALLTAMALGYSGCMLAPPGTTSLVTTSSTAHPSGEGEKGAELPPLASAQVNLKLAENFEKTGHPVEAVAYYERARAADPRLPGIAKHLAILYDRIGKTDQALAEFQTALKAAPNDPQVLNSLGYFHYNRGQWEDAEKYLRQAVDADPKYHRAWVNLGMDLCQQQRYDEGLAAFSQAVSKAEAHSNVAFILTVQGKFDKARLEYRNALELNPNLTIARQALSKLERRETPAAGTDPARVTPARTTSTSPAGI